MPALVAERAAQQRQHVLVARARAARRPAQRESSAELTSKYGFSVVAPISVTSPSSTAGSSASCWALLKRWISSRKKIVALAARARAGARRARSPRAPPRARRSPRTPPRRRRARSRRSEPGERRLAGARRPVQDHRVRRGPPRSPCAAPSPRPSRCSWPTNSSSVARPHPRRQRLLGRRDARSARAAAPVGASKSGSQRRWSLAVREQSADAGCHEAARARSGARPSCCSG